MCQINTDPMKSQMGYLDVVGKLVKGGQIARGLFFAHYVSVAKQSYASLPVCLALPLFEPYFAKQKY